MIHSLTPLKNKAASAAFIFLLLCSAVGHLNNFNDCMLVPNLIAPQVQQRLDFTFGGAADKDG